MSDDDGHESFKLSIRLREVHGTPDVSPVVVGTSAAVVVETVEDEAGQVTGLNMDFTGPETPEDAASFLEELAEVIRRGVGPDPEIARWN